MSSGVPKEPSGPASVRLMATLPIPGFARILNSVEIQIKPHEVADAAGALVPKIVSQDIVRRHRIRDVVTAGGAGITLQRPTGIEVGGGHHDGESSGVDLEAVLAVSVRGGRREDVSRVVLQFDEDSADAVSPRSWTPFPSVSKNTVSPTR